MVPRDHVNYVVSFIGFAPADDPQIVIYCVVDRPNVRDQPHATYATGIVKNILTEVLPYLHIARTEEMTIAEQEEADRLLGNIVQGGTADGEGAGSGDGEAGDAAGGENGDIEGAENGGSGEGGSGTVNPFYVVDPDTGELVDPVTGEPAEMNHVSEDSDVLPDPADDGADGPPAEE